MLRAHRSPGQACTGLPHRLSPAPSPGALLPIGIAVPLWLATRRADLRGGYRYPRRLLAVAWTAWLLTLYLAVDSIRPVVDLFS